MPNWCNVKLVVTGPATTVRRFIRRARPQPAKAAKRRLSATARQKRRRALPVLSFTALVPPSSNSNGEAATDVYDTDSTEPLDPWRDPTEEIAPGLLRVTYGFQTRWTPPERWVLAVASQVPDCCFVLGWVEPSMDLAGSLIAGRGATREYQLGVRRKAQVYHQHQRQ